jgi:hypothetical protein
MVISIVFMAVGWNVELRPHFSPHSRMGPSEPNLWAPAS